MTNNSHTTKGSVIIYMVLMIFLMMTSAAIVLSTILSKHIRASENYLSSEQAFAGANSGIEQMLYKIAKQGAKSKAEVMLEESTIEYDPEEPTKNVTFKGEGCLGDDGTAHLTASGVYRSLVRRIDLAGGSKGEWGQC